MKKTTSNLPDTVAERARMRTELKANGMKRLKKIRKSITKPAAVISITANKPSATANEMFDTANKPSAAANEMFDTANKPSATANEMFDTANKPSATANKKSDDHKES